ncbi:PREDICTED: probable sulfate transporter 3.4 isoform X1 [Camelina sativa]|uniref:Probable sulfate transporter 3.4 isoform X1 n=1 Tax=Camelina sativa TaxID=90675 RepID=A0ABM0XKU9_CAMSA|nr:PREDICTED: probable sulfate transporter 3.4 isoform X3 [Camelina sativa]XP_019096826.1 PREDICTED: probable sulfate transporter 3.4 isoform X1 [Camelina sativa]
MGHGTNRVEDMSSPNNGTAATATAGGETIVEIHSVCLPPKKTAFQKLKKRVADVFFPDDPLQRFRNQTWRNRVILGLQSLFPIFTWGSHYDLKLFRSDVVSGLTIASLAIPQGISYAKLANLPPIVGLYSSFVPPLIYAVLGSSKHLAVGPVSIASLVMGSMLSESVSPTQDPILYLQLAFTSTFFAGLFQASLGLLRLGFLIDFLSKATLVGFTAGAAVIVSLQQLKGLLGIVHFTGKMQFIPVMSSVFNHRSEWSWETIVMGMCFLSILLTTRHISMRKPKLFWISAAAPLASVIISTLLVYLIRSKTQAISYIGHLPKGLNPPSSNMLYFSGAHLALAIKTGIITGILSLTEGIAVGRTFASLKNYQVNGNKEMMAIGFMNMAGSCTSCYVTTGSFSRSAVNYNAGAKTAVSNIVMASAVLVTLLFLMPLFYYTPNVILAVIILTAVIGLIDYQAAYKLWKVDKFDFFTCMCSFFGVLFVSVPLGLAIAVGVSVIKILLHVTRPNTSEFGNIPGTQIYQSLGRYREASRIPGFLILAVESPIYFANSTYLQERILRWTREEETRIKENNGTTLKCIILDMTAVSAIDTSGLEAVFELRRRLEKQSLQLVLVNPVGTVMEKLHKSKIIDALGLSGLYLTVGEAVADLSSTWKANGQP